ncbi:hypothetical protein [Mangrovivirga cuniculi]|uniref:Outer membrane protein beta-barrel domain-containing protein n=1 Tax=Mangrovivirga cuniculi TaxID=2715131 RepID=A0A4D7JGX0_9BACT|nr:hypothetical protein [Mangrovivirga cuniculi]QCK13947.1 hypothetical protein DCC35_03845 [Mangrovivirga cuniculi]
MKKLIFIFSLYVSITSISFSQTYKPFSVDLGLGLGIPSDNAFDIGLLMFLEPSYKFTDQIEGSLKLEYGAFGGSDNYSNNISVAGLGSYLVGGKYYFNHNDVRFFGGLGLGVYQLGSFTYRDGANNEYDGEYGGKFGFAPELEF